jgi:DNA-binding NarL/FixJ family response regulator
MPRADVRVTVLADVGLVGDALAASLGARPEFVALGVIPPTRLDVPLRLAAGRPDVVIIDADAEDLDLPRCIAEVFRAVPGANVVVVGDPPDVSLAVAAVRAGAVAWCDRATSVERLVDVLLGVHHGEAWFRPTLLRQMLESLAAPLDSAAAAQPDGPDRPLSRGDAELLTQVALGAGTTEIAHALGMSAEEVRRRARRVMSTLAGSDVLATTAVGSADRTAGAGDSSPTD